MTTEEWRGIRGALAFGLVLFLPSWLRAAGPFYVDVAWSGTGSGTSGDPYTNICTAVAAANGGGGGTIYVAKGTYSSTNYGGHEDFGASGIVISASIALYGGYAGMAAGGNAWTEAARVLRSTVIDLTNANTRAFYRTGAAAELNWWPTVDGFTFKNALITGDGGAIGSTSKPHTGWILTNCRFENNVTTSGSGGAMYFQGEWNGVRRMTNCVFVNNRATGGTGCGGAVYADPGNYDGAQKFSVQACTFEGNQAAAHGGAVYSDVGGWAEFVKCLFRNNSAGNTSKGGALAIRSSSPTRYFLYQTLMSGNSAQYGSAVADLGVNRRATIYLENCLAIGNVATNGGVGALYTSGNGTFSEYAFDLAFCTVAGNVGGGIYNQESLDPPAFPYDGNLQVRNSIVAYNGTFGINYLFGDAGNHHAPSLGYNDVFGHTSDYLNAAVGQASNSISLNPRFHIPATNDYRLHVGSPCVDMGLNLSVTNDLIGALRPLGFGYDIGCYEGTQPPKGTLIVIL